MAIGAPDVALLDLSEDVLPIGVAAHEVNDRRPLIGSMVELKHDRICFPAIDAWMCHEVIPSLTSCIH